MNATSSTDAWNTWCPFDSAWSAWAKPLLFAIDTSAAPPLGSASATLDRTRPPWTDALRTGDFVIADMEGTASIGLALGLAERGYRPVPLFNGVPDSYGLVDATSIRQALHDTSPALARFALRADAPPVFLLDARRMTGHPAVGLFDNRWVVIPEDFPSAARLLSQGLRRCVLARPPAHTDLDHVLARYADAGITIVLAQVDQIVPFEVRRPSVLRSVFRRMFVQFGLRRSSAGGFGGIVPDASSSSG